MTQKQSYFYWKLGLSFSLFIGSVGVPIECVLAQLIPDQTLGTESSIVNNDGGGNSTQIDGGASRGSNLFHSFEQFNVGEQQTLFFNSSPGIVNILTRITGGSPSEILGSLGVIGNANLFLVNPNGIIFGKNARLDLNGSFLASTASSVIFSDGIQYSATNPQASSLLTVNTPTGLQYGETNTSIRVQEIDLDVEPDRTLALIGGEVSIEGSNLNAPDGRIELGSVANNSLLSLNSTAKGWSLDYENVANFHNIRITKGSFNDQSSVLDTSGDIGGNINLQGKQILLADTSQISSTTGGAGTGGNIVVNASELFLIQGLDSLLTTATTNTGSGGNITVNTGKLVLEDRAAISTDSSVLVISPGNTRLATGKAGNLTVNASISVELRNGSYLSSITQGSGDAGNINIDTPSLTVQNNAEVAVSSIGTGNAGNLTIAARTISLDNKGQLTATSDAGNGGGNIFLQDLKSLTLKGGSEISTDARGEGNGGNITINTDTLLSLGNSDITATAIEGRGGNIKIKTQGLFSSADSDIKATSDLGIDGVVEINRPENEPNDDTNSVSVEPVDLTELIAAGCGVSGIVASRTPSSKFIVTGRGGLPPTPTEALRSDRTLPDLGTSVRQDITARTTTATKQTNVASTPIVEAQGWVISPKGQVVLTASAPNVTPEVPWLKSPSCHNS